MSPKTVLLFMTLVAVVVVGCLIYREWQQFIAETIIDPNAFKL